MIVAGEASGDLHGARLVEAAQALRPDLEFYGMGGRRLAEAGVRLLFDLSHHQIIGFTEAVFKLRGAWSTLKTLKTSLAENRPAAVVLIDYPDFNFSLAKAAKRLGVPVFYYISPQLWAWRTGRVEKVRRFVDRMVVIFPFEKAFYQEHGIEADFVGHPLLDTLALPRPRETVKAELGFEPSRPLLLLLPGSRRSEIRQHLAPMVEAAGLVVERKPELQVAVAAAETVEPEVLAPFLSAAPWVRVVRGQTHALENAADAALSASGTATLETALMFTPLVVMYRLKPVTYFLLRRMTSVEHVAMPNLIVGRRLVPELLQKEARPDRMAAEVLALFEDSEAYARSVEGLKEVRERLGAPGASARAAGLLAETIETASSSTRG